MKKFILVFLVIAFLPTMTVNAQMAVADGFAHGLLAGSKLEQGIYWAQQALDMVESIARLQEMVERFGKQIEMQMDNLANIGNIHSFKDFTTWHNRQLYLERMTEDAWNGMSIKIGKKDYKLTDVEGMAYGFKDTYVDYWDKEFTEAQREEMYVGLGLTPANYAYIKTWDAREQQLAKEFLAARIIHNANYMDEMTRNNEKLNELEKDKKKKADDPSKMGEKGVAVINAETNIANNKALNDINMNLLDLKEMIAVEKYQKKIKLMTPSMTKWDKEDGIKPLK